jgi:hypothetical protein
MTARSIRRAAERKARKLAAKESRLTTVYQRAEDLHVDEAAVYQRAEDSNVDEAAVYQRAEDSNVDEAAVYQRAEDLHVVKTEARPVSDIQLTANKENARRSSGPRTEGGKAVSSMNAVKTGLTGRTVLLPSDDVEAYQTHITIYEREFRPIGLRERELVQSIADTQWRLQRVPGLEMAIYAKGRDEFADQFNELTVEIRNARIDLETTLHYQKPLRNLQLQESRLRRQREKDMAELKALQAERNAAELAEFEQLAARRANRQPANGFVFSDPLAAASPTPRTTAAPFSGRTNSTASGPRF